eukprot:jgi/Mesvir1/12233/Mv00454-RA.1
MRARLGADLDFSCAHNLYAPLHIQGRRWGAIVPGWEDNKFNAAPTFKSYGVDLGDYEGLVKAVPEAHRQFLKNLAWVHECTLPDGVRLIAVHAGLEDKDDVPSVEEQLECLRRRDVTLPWIEGLCGRRKVLPVPRELVGTKTLIISGHHGFLSVREQRIILDESRGNINQPLVAILLPSRTLVKDMDSGAHAKTKRAEVYGDNGDDD